MNDRRNATDRRIKQMHVQTERRNRTRRAIDQARLTHWQQRYDAKRATLDTTNGA